MVRLVVARFLGLFLAGRVYTIINGLAKGLERKGGLGFMAQLRRLTKGEKFLMDLDLRGQTVYDIGGYEGIFTLFFAEGVGSNGKVITFEPNPMNFEKIKRNIKLNGFDNVVVRQVGLGREKKKA